MAIPPCYADLGKAARDIFGKGYGECIVSLMFSCLVQMQCYCRLYKKHERKNVQSSLIGSVGWPNTVLAVPTVDLHLTNFK